MKIKIIGMALLCSLTILGAEKRKPELSVYGGINSFAGKLERLGKRPRDVSNSEIARQFIAQGQGLNPLSPEGFDILELALSHKDVETVRSLIQAGMHLKSEDDQGRTPLILAILYGNLSAVKIFIRAGAEVNYSGIGLSPLHSVAIQGTSGFGANTTFFYDCAKILMYAGATIPSQEENDRTSEKCLQFIQKISEKIKQEQQIVFDAHAAFHAAKTTSQNRSVHPMLSQRLQRMLEEQKK